MAASQRNESLSLPLEAPPVSLASQGATAYSVSAQWVKNSKGLRFDASHYNPLLAHALTILRSSGMELKPLGEVCKDVFIPPRFKRIYVDKAHGVPFLQGSHLVHSDPADIKYLSTKAHANIKKWRASKTT